ncbi:unnamed protein product, partial [Mesorhabditis spiculigera]
MAAVATLLSSCSSSDGSGTSDDTQMRTVTTPLGTYDIPTNPKRVLAVDARTDLELAIALELQVFGYNISPATEWVPVDGSAEYLSDKPNLEQILGLAPDLIICVNADNEYWPAAKTPSHRSCPDNRIEADVARKSHATLRLVGPNTHHGSPDHRLRRSDHRHPLSTRFGDRGKDRREFVLQSGQGHDLHRQPARVGGNR